MVCPENLNRETTTMQPHSTQQPTAYADVYHSIKDSNNGGVPYPPYPQDGSYATYPSHQSFRYPYYQTPFHYPPPIYQPDVQQPPATGLQPAATAFNWNGGMLAGKQPEATATAGVQFLASRGLLCGTLWVPRCLRNPRNPVI